MREKERKGEIEYVNFAYSQPQMSVGKMPAMSAKNIVHKKHEGM